MMVMEAGGIVNILSVLWAFSVAVELLLKLSRIYM
jgi:hypothetical protein